MGDLDTILNLVYNDEQLLKMDDKAKIGFIVAKLRENEDKGFFTVVGMMMVTVFGVVVGAFGCYGIMRLMGM